MTTINVKRYVRKRRSTAKGNDREVSHFHDFYAQCPANDIFDTGVDKISTRDVYLQLINLHTYVEAHARVSF